MIEHTLISLTAVITLGIAAQWLGWRLRLPAILLLLLFGIVAGPVTGFIRPAAMMGSLLYPTVSLAVALILFEGGLSLSVKEFRAVGGIVGRLVSLGVITTWGLTSLAARTLLGLEWPLAVLLGAVLVVTGPTVIVPMLQHIRPTGISGPVLKWEGIVIDPIGAVLGVLVFEIILAGGATWGEIGVHVGFTAGTGAIMGLAAAAGLVLLLRRDWVPDFLQVPVTVMLVVLAFTLANLMRSESGLLAVTVMGFALANQKYVSVQHIVEFKENLRVMLIATIFILLAANLRPADLAELGLGSLLFLATLLFVVRPAAVFASTLGARLETREKLFLAWLAPRGIVAASVASVFALRLHEIGYPEADRLVAITFYVIIGTVVVYGLTSGRLARRLGLTKKGPGGVLVLGGSPWVRSVAKALIDEGFAVILVDNNWHNIRQARMEGVPAFYASAFSDTVLERVELGGIGQLLAMTTNDEINSLVALHYAPVFGRNRIYQLAPQEAKLPGEVSRHLRGRILFGEGITHSQLSRRFDRGWTIKKTKLTEEFGYEDFKSRYRGEVLPLFFVSDEMGLQAVSVESPVSPGPGQTAISLVKAEENSHGQGEGGQTR